MAEEIVSAPAPEASSVEAAPEPAQTEGVNNVENNQTEAETNIPTSAEEAFSKAMEKDLQGMQQGNTNNVPNEFVNDTAQASQETNEGIDINKQLQNEPEETRENDTANRNDPVIRARQQYEQLGRSTTKQIVERAKQEARQYMQQNKYRPIGLKDIQQYDEDTRTVTWVNPYNPNEPFTNLREAKSFIADFNESIAEEEKKVFNESIKKWTEKVTPYMEMERFNIRYKQMDPVAKKVLLQTVIGKAKRHPETGQIIKFDCDLDAAADTVEQILRTIRTQSSKQNTNVANTQAQPVSQPPVDMTSSNVNTNNIQEEEVKPKNVSEAFSLAMKKDMLKNKKKG